MISNQLDLRHFRLVREIVNTGSLTAAAKQLSLSQSALSHQLRDIEDRLGIALFDRQGRSLILTPAGQRILVAAQPILDEVARAEADLAALATGQQGTLRVASECYTTYHWLPAILLAFGTTDPDVNVELAQAITERPGEALLDRTVDVALVTFVEHMSDNIMLTPLFDDEVVAVVAETHPWAGQPFVPASAFTGQHLLTYQACQDRDCVYDLMTAAQAKPSKITPIPLSTEAIMGMVRANLGITTIATWAAQPYLNQGGLRTVSITQEGLYRTWYAATRSQNRPAYLNTFVDLLAKIDATTGVIRHEAAPLDYPTAD